MELTLGQGKEGRRLELELREEREEGGPRPMPRQGREMRPMLRQGKEGLRRALRKEKINVDESMRSLGCMF